MLTDGPLAPHACNFPIELLNDPRFRSLSGVELRVLVFIVAHRNSRTGDSYPSLPLLADYLECDVRSASRAVYGMEVKRILTVTRAAGVANRYRVIPLDEIGTPVKTVTGANSVTPVKTVLEPPSKLSETPVKTVRRTSIEPLLEPLPLTPKGEFESKRKNESDSFESFWQAWPKHFRKSAKAKCKRRWHKLGCDEIVDDVMASLAWWAKSAQWTKQDREFIPFPLTWLNNQPWEADAPPPPAAQPSNNQPTIDVGTRPATLTEAMASLEAAGIGVQL